MKQITTVDLNKIKESLVDKMKLNFKNSGSILPVVFIIAPNGDLTIIATPYTSHEEKDFMMNTVRQMCKRVDAIAVCIINEAWVRIAKGSLKEAEKEMKDAGKRISDYDDKKEVALMMFETKLTGETIMFDMDRTNNELINKTGGMTAGGSFSNILSPIINKN